MALVDQSVSSRPVTPETVLDVLNREVIPVLRRIREVMNARIIMIAATVGDGVTLAWPVTHNLGTKDVVVEAYTISTGVTLVPTSIVRTDDDTVTVTFAAAPALDDARVLVRQ